MGGYLPPQNLDAEKSVIGVLLQNSEKIDEIFSIIQSEEMFYDNNHKIIFSAIFKIYESGGQADIITVSEELSKLDLLEEIGGNYALALLSSESVSYTSVLSHALIVKENFLKREIIKIANDAMVKAYDGSFDVFELLDNVSSDFSKLSQNITENDLVNAETIFVEVAEKMQELRLLDNEMTGIDTGLPELNDVTNGWQKSDLIILGARPSMGKTAFSLNLAVNASKTCNVAFFSLEMSKNQLVERVVSSETEIPLKEIKRPKTMRLNNWQSFANVSGVANNSLFVCDKGNLSPYQIKAKFKALVRKEQKQRNNKKDWLLIIDYLQLMQSPNVKGGNREQEISKISRELKTLAKEMNVPIIALSQLSRAVEQRGKESKMPQLSDLRESGAIEQDADMVAFLHRPAYYGEKVDEDGVSLENTANLHIAKHRNGELDTLKFFVDLSIQKFKSLQGLEEEFKSFNPNAGISQNYDREPEKLPNINDEFLPF